LGSIRRAERAALKLTRMRNLLVLKNYDR
jgi:hypothetical protein